MPVIPLADATRKSVRFPLDSGGVAYMAHVGGAFFGILTARLFERNVHRSA